MFEGPVMKGNLIQMCVSMSFFPIQINSQKTSISIGVSGGSIIHLFGGEQNPARLNSVEVTIW